MSTPILKTLQADPDSVPDLEAHTPAGLEGAALEVWDHFVRNTPYWWSVSDLLTVERYCFLIGVDRNVRTAMNTAQQGNDFKRYADGWAVMKSLSIELKNVEYSLGVTPQGRAALKLAHPDNQMDRETPEDSGDPIDPADLV